MIDIKFLRENPEVVKENIRKKYQDEKLPLVDEVIALDTESRKAKQEADDLRASRNRISKEIGALMGQGKKEEAEAKKAEVAAGAKRLAELEASDHLHALRAGRPARIPVVRLGGGRQGGERQRGRTAATIASPPAPTTPTRPLHLSYKHRYQLFRAYLLNF